MNWRFPICQANCQTLRSMAFPQKPSLPQQISISVCEDCDFGFTSPRDKAGYRAFYGANLNDNLGTDLNLTNAETLRYKGQIEILQSMLDVNHSLRILDVGCGQAGFHRSSIREIDCWKFSPLIEVF